MEDTTKIQDIFCVSKIIKISSTAVPQHCHNQVNLVYAQLWTCCLTECLHNEWNCWWKSIEWFTHSLPKPSHLGPTGKIQEVSVGCWSLMLCMRGSHVLLSFISGCTKCIGFNHYYFKKKGKKRKISVYCFREQHFVCFDKVNPVIFPFTCFSLENKGISETCSYMDRKILLKVGLEVKLVNLELSYIEVPSELNFKEQILYWWALSYHEYVRWMHLIQIYAE